MWSTWKNGLKRSTLASLFRPSAHERCNPARPFSSTGVDYFDPIFIRDRKGRGAQAHKAQGAVFVCLVTRAIHLELVTHLDTPSFILTFDRFVSRRGKPHLMMSDNRNNVVGANAELAVKQKMKTFEIH